MDQDSSLNNKDYLEGLFLLKNSSLFDVNVVLVRKH